MTCTGVYVLWSESNLQWEIFSSYNDDYIGSTRDISEIGPIIKQWIEENSNEPK